MIKVPQNSTAVLYTLFILIPALLLFYYKALTINWYHNRCIRKALSTFLLIYKFIMLNNYKNKKTLRFFLQLKSKYQMLISLHFFGKRFLKKALIKIKLHFCAFIIILFYFTSCLLPIKLFSSAELCFSAGIMPSDDGVNAVFHD